MSGLVAAIVVFAGVAACASGGGSASSAGNSMQLAHVHGLGVDPGTGELYAGSHYGLTRFPQRGEPSRVGGGKAWDTRARIAMADLAVNPKDQQTLLATTQQGVARSTDGGQVSSDGGTTWSHRGSAGGAPEALTASGNQIYAAVEGKIVSSDDGGSTFKTRYEGS